MTRITINSVAKQAEVSKTTVSHVFNNTPNARIKKETRQKVINALQELNYQPNVLAQGLTKRRVQHIGVVVSTQEQAETFFFSEILKGIRKAAEDNEYYPVICPLQDRISTNSSKILANMVKTGRVDGLIIDKEDVLTAEVLKMVEQELPFVIINGHVPQDKKTIYSVCVDNYYGAYQAVSYLIRQGHQRIGFINQEYKSISPKFRRKIDIDRLRGYSEAFKNHGLPYDNSLLAEGSLFDRTKTYSAIERLMNLPSPPTAFFITDDTIAISAINIFLAKGVKVPEDISVVGYNDLPIISIIEPSLTTIRAPLLEMGKLATEMLIKILDGNKVITNPNILLKPHLVARKSCKPIKKINKRLLKW